MTDTKIVYAQSSDIKSRTFREYRRDMKKKAIAELEFLPFLQSLLEGATVEKYGSDADLWFLPPKGRLTQDPDYRAVWSEPAREMLYEFQYTEDVEKLKYFDFKVSKVGRKHKGKRTPHDDRKFFYVVKPHVKYAFIEPNWIMEKGREGPVPAWGSRPAFRVPVSELDGSLKDGGKEMGRIIRAIDDKNSLLIFQDKFLDLDTDDFSREIQAAVDDKRLIKIVPTTLGGFYRACFLLEKMRRVPQNPGVWLVYLASFFKPGIPAVDFARWSFALDFLYFSAVPLSDNEKPVVSRALNDARGEIQNRAKENGSFAGDPNASPAEETRCFLFAANLLEDIQQDFAVQYGEVAKVRRIYDILPDFAKTAAFVRDCEAAA